MSKIPLSKCFVNPEVEEAALRAIRSGQYILGAESKAFEAELAAHTGTATAVLGSSWTMIVYLLHQIQGIGPARSGFGSMQCQETSLVHLTKHNTTPLLNELINTCVITP